jgi:alpha-D-xyloside xylohydrolase
MWLTAADKRVEYAEYIYSIDEAHNGRSLELLCPTKHIFSRGDTLNCPTLTLKLEAEFDGVISVEVTHWHGALRRGPEFELFPDGRPHAPGWIDHGKNGRCLTSGKLAATVSRDPHAFTIKFHDSDEPGKLVTAMLNRSVGFAYSPPTSNMKQVEDMRDKKHYIFTQTELGVGESIHGLGERFGAFNKVGQHVEIWNEDGGTSSDQAYKNIPFLLSSAGYGIFFDTPELIDLEIGSERCCRLQASVESQRLKWYIIYGPTPKQVLTKYCQITGRPAQLPAWSYGLWLTTSFTTDYDEATVTGFLTEMKKREIPLEVFHYDCFWMRAFHWCDWVFSPQRFPSPKHSIERLKSANLLKKVCVWINPYLGQASPIFNYAAERGFLLKRQNGDIWQWDLWQAGMGLIDLTNPEACQWYSDQLEYLFNTGVDCLKTDFGERIPTTDVAWHDPSVDPKKMHNYYAFIYNRLCHRALEARFNDTPPPSIIDTTISTVSSAILPGVPGAAPTSPPVSTYDSSDRGVSQAVLFARAATAGSQRFPLCWGGDCESTSAALAESIRGGLGLGLSGFTYWSCDIGGFEGSPEPWIYKRWVAFGLLCSHSRLHGSNSYRVPWLIDNDSSAPDSATNVLRTFVRVKRSLMPYIFAQAKESALHGWPLSLRATALEFPDDPTAWYLDRQFMLGSQILIAPVFTESGDVTFYLPEGRWSSFWDGNRTLKGNRWHKERHGFDTLPIYVREGTILVMGQEEPKDETEGFDYEWLGAENGEVRLYHVRPGCKVGLVDAQGRDRGALKVDDDGDLRGLHCLGNEGKDWNVVSYPEGLVEGSVSGL